MNIWFFNHYAVPPSLYPLARTTNFAKYMLIKGHDSIIFAASTVHNTDKNLVKNRSKNRKIVDGIKYTFIYCSCYHKNKWKRILNMFQYAIGLFLVSKKFPRPDIILASSVHPLTCVAGIIIAKINRCKCVIEITDLWPSTLIDFGIICDKSFIAKIMYYMEHWIYKKANAIIFSMEGGKEYILDKGWQTDVDIRKINYINNGIDLEQYLNYKNNILYQDSDLDNASIFKIVYTGTIGKANSIEYILKAAKYLKNDYPNIKFLLFGDGYLKEKFIEYCLKNKLNNVIFKGKVDKKYIPNILSRSNLNIITGEKYSIYKYGISMNKIFDYIASGRPTLSNIECGFDVLESNMCGRTVEGNSVEVLAEGISFFVNMQKDEYERYCKNASETAKKFDFLHLTDRLEKIFIDTLNGE